MTENRQQGLASSLRWIARIIAIIAALFLGSLLISETIARILEGGLSTALEPLPEVLTLIGIFIIAVAGCVLAWWRERLAGILLVITSLTLVAHIAFFEGVNHLYSWSRVGFPCLVAGILLLISRQQGRGK